MPRGVYPDSTENLDITLGGLAMYARVTSAQIDLKSIEKFTDIFEKSVVPAAKKQKGFKEIVLMIDSKTGEGMAIGYWESEENALATEKNLFYQEQVAKFLPLYTRNPIRQGYEVFVKE
jgi:heme-degrading monooxygenase HmoA